MGSNHRTMRFAAAGAAVAATLGLAGSAAATTTGQSGHPQAGAARPAAAGAGGGGSTSGPTDAQIHYVRIDGRWVPIGTGGNAVPAEPGGAPAGHAARCGPCPHGHHRHGPACVAPAHRSAVHTAVTAVPSVKSVQAWHPFHVSGTTSGIAPGSTVTLQQEQHGRFVPLPASVHTDHHGGYRMRVELGIKGVNQLRMTIGSVTSPVFTVTVR
ncbi:hypothetical protein AB0O91_16080 [Kitasatospora sp. NPDC089797]|uniref:hypothetical protein n=1 Tax=Kitasatospora sp. NPDC089797 TaxID=3155298 RepID=UPI0034355676